MSGVSSPPTDPLLELYTAPYSDYAGVALRIRTKGATLVPFRFNQAQRIVDAKVSAQRREIGRVRAIILKARQEGISTYIAGRFHRRVNLWPWTVAMVIADVLKRSDELFAIYDRFRLNLPDELRPQTRYTGKRGLAYGSRDGHGLDSKILVDTAGDLDAGRSLTIQCLHASECAFWEHPEDTLLSLLEAVPAAGSEVFLESTANGVGGAFHLRWEAAVAGDSGWLPIFLPWWIHGDYRISGVTREALGPLEPWERQALDVGIAWEPPGPGIEDVLESGARWHARRRAWLLTPGQIAWRRWKISDDLAQDERRFRQEFPSTDDEAFLLSGAAFFDPEALEDIRSRVRPPARRGRFVRVGGGLVFQDDERGWVRMWEEPSPGAHYVIGGDTAEGKMVAARDTSFSDPEGERGGRDFNSADVIKVSEVRNAGGKTVRVACRRQVAHVHGRMAPEAFAEQVWAVGNWYGCPGPKPRSPRRPALVGIERNHASGQTTIRELRERHRYPRLYVARRMNARTGKPTMNVGWSTDAHTRRPMLDALAAAVRTGEVEVNAAETLKEMRTFVMDDEGKPQAQEGAHDDRVLSLGIALEMARHHTDEPVGDLPELEDDDTDERST